MFHSHRDPLSSLVITLYSLDANYTPRADRTGPGTVSGRKGSEPVLCPQGWSVMPLFNRWVTFLCVAVFLLVLPFLSFIYLNVLHRCFVGIVLMLGFIICRFSRDRQKLWVLVANTIIILIIEQHCRRRRRRRHCHYQYRHHKHQRHRHHHQYHRNHNHQHQHHQHHHNQYHQYHFYHHNHHTIVFISLLTVNVDIFILILTDVHGFPGPKSGGAQL